VIIGLTIPDSSSPSESSFTGLASPNSQAASLFAKHLDQAAVDATFDSPVGQSKPWQFRGTPSERSAVARQWVSQAGSRGTFSSEVKRKASSGSLQPGQDRTRKDKLGTTSQSIRSSSKSGAEAVDDFRSPQAYRSADAQAPLGPRQIAQLSQRRKEAEATQRQDDQADRNRPNGATGFPVSSSDPSNSNRSSSNPSSSNPSNSDLRATTSKTPNEVADKQEATDRGEQAKSPQGQASDSASGSTDSATDQSSPAQTEAGRSDMESSPLQTNAPNIAPLADAQVSQAAHSADTVNPDKSGPPRSHSSAPIGDGTAAASETMPEELQSSSPAAAGKTAPGWAAELERGPRRALGTDTNRQQVASTASIGQPNAGRDLLAEAKLQQTSLSGQEESPLALRPRGAFESEERKEDSGSIGSSAADPGKLGEPLLGQILNPREAVSEHPASETGLFAASSFGLQRNPSQDLKQPGATDVPQANQATTPLPDSGLSESAVSMNLDLQFDPFALSPTNESNTEVAALGELALAAQSGEGSESGSRFGRNEATEDLAAESRKHPQSETESGLDVRTGIETLEVDSRAEASIGLRAMNSNRAVQMREATLNGAPQNQRAAEQALAPDQNATPSSPIAEPPIVGATSGFSGPSGTNSAPATNTPQPQDSTLSSTRSNLEALTQKPLAATVHQLRIEIPIPGADGNGNEKIQLHFNQRNSALNLGIQANNSDLGLELRDALPELTRKLGAGGWQAEAGSGSGALRMNEPGTAESQNDFARPFERQDLSRMLADRSGGRDANHGNPDSTSEGSENQNGKAHQEATLRQETTEGESAEQRSGQQGNFTAKDGHNSDSPRRDRRGRQQSWNRAWTGLNSGLPANSQVQLD
jgi:hypothetical protein